LSSGAANFFTHFAVRAIAANNAKPDEIWCRSNQLSISSVCGSMKGHASSTTPHAATAMTVNAQYIEDVASGSSALQTSLIGLR
jgi:hypothetical protein